jgi:peptidoglycan/xylan/chitin deacetylase (PgdA/CDA1 family)
MKPRRYGPFPYIPINRRPKLGWPNGSRIALYVVPNVGFFGLDEHIPGTPGAKVPNIREWAIRDYGNRVGVFRLMEVLSKHGIRATVALNSDICDHHPEIIEDAIKLKWELIGHNQTNSRRLNDVPAEQEREVIRSTLDRIASACGKRPVGWLSAGLHESWNSLDHLAEEGILYVLDWVNDDQPYVMTLGTRTILSLPYFSEINDKPAYETQNLTPEEFERMLRRQFDVLYREAAQSGRVLAVGIHPYLSGQPHRIDALDRALGYIGGYDGVWRATGNEIARHFLAQRETKGSQSMPRHAG